MYTKVFQFINIKNILARKLQCSTSICKQHNWFAAVTDDNEHFSKCNFKTDANSKRWEERCDVLWQITDVCDTMQPNAIIFVLTLCYSNFCTNYNHDTLTKLELKWPKTAKWKHSLLPVSRPAADFVFSDKILLLFCESATRELICIYSNSCIIIIVIINSNK